LVGLLVAVFASALFLGERKSVSWGKRFVPSERQPWMTIFVHGSFGSVLGLLNLKQLIADDVAGTAYKKASGRMRKDPYFFGDQPLMKKGLVAVAPTFDIGVTDNKKYAVYPMLKVYESMTEYAKPSKEKNYFYTFGWSGLMSQSRRRKEAIRFYNALHEELEKYHKIGIYPKVRILAHSHGGNLVAYLSAIEELLQPRLLSSDRTKQVLPDKGLSPKDDRVKPVSVVALSSMRDQIKKLPSSKQRKKKGQKVWDYKPCAHEPRGHEPNKSGLSVDELILWGVPVQPETDCLFASPFFKTVYHFYSNEDLVQRIDWISTKQGYSDRRFDADRLAEKKKKTKSLNRIMQARIMVGKKIDKLGQSAFSLRLQNALRSENGQKNEKKKQSWWEILFSGGSFLNATSKDPTHRELWFFTWDTSGDHGREFALKPFPAMVFTPVLTKLYKQTSLLSDVDINVNVGLQHIAFELVAHEESALQKGFLVKKSFLQDLETKIEPWRCQRAASRDVLDLIRQYTRF